MPADAKISSNIAETLEDISHQLQDVEASLTDYELDLRNDARVTTTRGKNIDPNTDKGIDHSVKTRHNKVLSTKNEKKKDQDLKNEKKDAPLKIMNEIMMKHLKQKKIQGFKSVDDYKNKIHAAEQDTMEAEDDKISDALKSDLKQIWYD